MFPQPILELLWKISSALYPTEQRCDCILLTGCLSGVGGNLVAVQASRISTYLHINGVPMGDPNPTSRKCPTPCTTFFGSCKLMDRDAVWTRGHVPLFFSKPGSAPSSEFDPGFKCLCHSRSFKLRLFAPAALNARSARVLFLLVAPGHLIFLYTINSLRGGHTTLTPVFISFYLAAALLQVRSHNAHQVEQVARPLRASDTNALLFGSGDDPSLHGGLDGSLDVGPRYGP